jgi:hypothetical protein
MILGFDNPNFLIINILQNLHEYEILNKFFK